MGDMHNEAHTPLRVWEVCTQRGAYTLRVWERGTQRGAYTPQGMEG